MVQNCEAVRRELPGLLGDRTESVSEERLRAHLDQCPACAREFQSLQDTWERLPSTGDAAPPRAARERVTSYARDVADGVVAHVPAARVVSGRKGQWLAVGGIIGALVAAVIIGMLMAPDVRILGPGSRAPNFVAADLVTGDTVTLADYEGDVVLLNIWATWCKPCEAEMPSFERLYQQLGPEGLRIVAVSVDNTGAAGVLEWVRERNLTFEVLHDRSGRIEGVYQVTGIPETFVIDRRGEIINRHIGHAQWDDPVHSAMFRQILGLN